MSSASLPGVRALAGYRPAWLRHDVVAGIVLATLLVPQGMACAELAGLPAITGLYTSISLLSALPGLFNSFRMMRLPDPAPSAATKGAVLG